MSSRLRWLLCGGVCGFAFVAGSLGDLPAVSQAQEKSGADAAKLQAARKKALDFLRTSQSDDGSWTSSTAPGITGLVTAAMLHGGATTDDPAVQKALKHLSTFIQEDGGIYYEKTGHKNYETSICLLAFHAANKDHKYDKLIANARDLIKKLQWDETEGIGPDDIKYGGTGYGQSMDRPDLSNTAFLIDALKAAGVGKDDTAMKNAVIFVSRCQNLESQNNTTPFASKVNDGGFYYTPAAGGQSPAGKTDNGGLRSYASITYAGFKSLIHAGLGPDDPRVKAALQWMRKNYTLEENPGMGQAGLFYYYQAFAKSLSAANINVFEDAAGKKHDWRKELGDRILSLQKDNGSWVNPEKRWMEADPNLTTAYVLLALQHCDPPAKK